DAGRRLEPVQRSTREADPVDPVELAERPRRAAADVALDRRPARKIEHGATGRTLVVLGDADAHPREVELERRTVEDRARDHQDSATAISPARAASSHTRPLFAGSVRPSLRSCRNARTNGVPC